MNTTPALTPQPTIYRHTQTGTLLLTVMGILFAVVSTAATLSLMLSGAAFFGAWVSWLAVVVLLTAGVMLASLTVTVTPTELRVAFGAGLVHRTIPLAIVRGAEPVRNSWWWGWGIRWTPYGWLWCVAGLDAVQITYASGKQFRVGTNQPKELSAALYAAIASQPQGREGN